MIPLADYLRIKKRIERRAGLFLVPFFLVILLESIALISILPKQGRNSVRHEPTTEETALGFAGLGVIVATLVGGMGVLIRYVPQPEQVPELNCPHCHAPYRDPQGLVVATGKCPRCLKHVVKVDAAVEPPPRPLLMVETLRRVKRNQFRMLVFFMTFYLPMMVLPLAAIGYYLLFPGASELKKGGAGFWIFMTSMCLGPAIGLVLYGWRSFVRCPRCRKSILTLETVIASGNCPHCGGGIVKDAMPHSEYRPLPKMATIDAAAKHYRFRSTMRAMVCFAVSMSAAVVITLMTKASAEIGWGSRVFIVAHTVASFVMIGAVLWILVVRYRRDPALICVHCKQPISENTAVLRCTGNCPHCGQRAIKDA